MKLEQQTGRESLIDVGRSIHFRACLGVYARVLEGLFTTFFNRAVGRMTLFRREKDFLAFEKVLLQTVERLSSRLVRIR